MVDERKILDILSTIPDPEIPVINIIELGIVRKVDKIDDQFVVTISPTYQGCPALDQIEFDILEKLKDEGVDNALLERQISPPWTTDWITEEGKNKLRAFGIAPPVGSADKSILTGATKIVPCPLCGSEDTMIKALFGSTACKSMYVCQSCLEPFDYFRCH